MNREEIENKIKELKERVFLINMSDHLSTDDWNDIKKYNAEIKKLEESLY